MIELRSTQGVADLSAFVHKQTLLSFDFDGTLVPLAKHPADIVVQPKLMNLLTILNTLAPIGIISGRSRADVLHHFTFLPRFVIGNHGAENPLNPALNQDLICKWREAASTLLKSRFGHSRAWIEDKHYSLTIHCQDKDILEAIQQQLIENYSILFASAHFMPGIHTLNIIAAYAPTKGDALLSIMQETQSTSALYVGDEITDEHIFQLDPLQIFSIRIGNDSTSKANYYLSNQSEMLWLLETIADLYTNRLRQ